MYTSVRAWHGGSGGENRRHLLLALVSVGGTSTAHKIMGPCVHWAINQAPGSLCAAPFVSPLSSACARSGGARWYDGFLANLAGRACVEFARES